IIKCFGKYLRHGIPTVDVVSKTGPGTGNDLSVSMHLTFYILRIYFWRSVITAYRRSGTTHSTFTQYFIFCYAHPPYVGMSFVQCTIEHTAFSHITIKAGVYSMTVFVVNNIINFSKRRTS